MVVKLINQETKEFLIAKIRTLQFGEEQAEEVIIDSKLKEGSEWQNKLRNKKCLRCVLDYSHLIINDILTIRKKKSWNPYEINLTSAEFAEYEECKEKDNVDLIKRLEKLSKNKQDINDFFTILKTILGNDLTNWETRIVEKTKLDQAEQQIKDLEKQLKDHVCPTNNPQQPNQNQDKLTEQINQLTADLEKSQKQTLKEPNIPVDYQNIREEIGKLKNQTANNDLTEKMLEIINKMLEREREQKDQPPTTASQQSALILDRYRGSFYVSSVGGEYSFAKRS